MKRRNHVFFTTVAGALQANLWTHDNRLRNSVTVTPASVYRLSGLTLYGDYRIILSGSITGDTLTASVERR
jgi:hypothetical protein